MDALQATKWAVGNADFTVDNAAYTVASVDTKGYAACTIAVAFGNVPANVGALKVTESDDDSSYSDLTNTVVGTATNVFGSTSALPTAASGDGKVTIFHIDLKGRKRYLKAAVTAGNGSGTVTECCVLYILHRAQDMPVTATERNVADVLKA